MSDKKIFFGLVFFYLLFNLIILKDYALSWDYHYHYYAGLFHLGKTVPSVFEASDIPFSPPDPRLTFNDPFGPFTQIVPTLSQIVFFEKLRLLPFDIAYNLPMVLSGALGILILYLFLFELISLQVALIGSIFLGLNPSYFGYLHNNMKDIPNSAFFALSIWLFYRLDKYKNIKSLFLASLAFAVAFNIKINSVFIPVICGIYFIIGNFKKMFSRKNLPVLAYFILAPLLAILLWWQFWRDPVAKLLELPRFYSLNTFNMPVLYFGEIFRSGINIPPLYPYVYLMITTPLPVLIPALIGLMGSIYLVYKKKFNYLLLLLWFFIPLVRYLHPRTSAIDGVRHFMEVLYPLSALGGVGFYLIFRKVKGKLFNLFLAVIVSVLVFNNIKYHPYQTSYFNLLIGGIRGAEGKFDIDFWGTPQKEAVNWLNKNAPSNSFVHIVMGQSTAAVYLRTDLQKNANKKNINDSDYVVLLNRQSFFDLYGVSSLIKLKEREGKIVYLREIEGVPLVWIFTN